MLGFDWGDIALWVALFCAGTWIGGMAERHSWHALAGQFRPVKISGRLYFLKPWEHGVDGPPRGKRPQ